MFNDFEILETLSMFREQHLDVRTITMGINLLDCASDSSEKACQRIYDKICRKAEHLVKRAKTSAMSSVSRSSTSASQSPRSRWSPHPVIPMITRCTPERSTTLPKRSGSILSAAIQPWSTKASPIRTAV